MKLPDEPGGCWEWTGARQHGYGVFKIHPKMVKAHRYAYERFVGPIPDGLQLDHFKCENKGCVNPEHVRPVTIHEHVLRTDGTFGSENAAKTHCPQGHPYDEANTYEWKGRRICRTCDRIRHGTDLSKPIIPRRKRTSRNT